MSLLIKNFGHDTQCEDVEALKAALKEKYQGKSVSVIETLSSGIKRAHFVTVNNDGKVEASYQDKAFDFNQLDS